MTVLFANNAVSTLAAGISSSATTAALATGTGVLFPAPAPPNYFQLTFQDAATGLLKEIVSVTNVTSDTITMVRAQEGTSALNWNAGDIAAAYLTAGGLAAMAQLSNVGGFAIDTGTANAIAVSLTPAPLSLAALEGVPIRILKIASPNNGVTTVNVNNFGATTLIHPNGLGMEENELPGSGMLAVVYDGTHFQLQTVSGIAPRVFTYAGNPNSNVPGTAASGTTPPDLCWDSTDELLYFCTTTGNASTAVWLSVASMLTPTGIGPPPGIRGHQEYTAAGTYTFTVPDNVYVIEDTVVAGGGGGGAANGSTNAGTGGGGGGYSWGVFNVTPGQEITVVVGAGGAGGTGAGNGTAGGSSSVESLNSSPGGGGGNSNGISGGSSAAGTGGQINAAGGGGGSALYGASPSLLIGGAGGGSCFGTGGVPNGGMGSPPGAGGAGGGSAQPNGGAGQVGYVSISW